MKRTIAHVARAVWDDRVRAGGKFRKQGKLDIDRLEEGGTVDVLVTEKALDVEAEARKCMIDAASGEYLFMVTGAAAANPNDEHRVFSYPVTQAKGLEARRVIVNCPFGHQAGRRARDRLPADDVMEFYVAASRAREHLLLIVDGASWHELRRCPEPWGMNGVRIHERVNDSNFDLQSIIRNCIVTLSDEELRQALLGQLDTCCQTSDSESPRGVDDLVRIIRRLCERPDPDLIDELLQRSRMLVRYRVSALHELWIRGCAAHRAGETPIAVEIGRAHV